MGAALYQAGRRDGQHAAATWVSCWSLVLRCEHPKFTRTPGTLEGGGRKRSLRRHRTRVRLDSIPPPSDGPSLGGPRDKGSPVKRRRKRRRRRRNREKTAI